MYCLRRFIVVLQELYCLLQRLLFIFVVCYLESMCVPSFILIGYCVSELNGPIVMYGLMLFIVVLYTRSTMFTELFICLYDQS